MKKMMSLVKETFKEFGEDKVTRLAAALSYYAIFSLAPLLVIVIAIAGFVWGQAAAQGALTSQIQGLVGQSGAQQVQTMIQNAYKPGAGIIATIISVIVLIFGATGVFTALQDSFNTIWEVQPKPGRGVRNMIADRFLSFAMILAIGFLLLVSLVISAVLSVLGKFMAGALPFSSIIMQVINIAVSFLVITLLFTLMFKYLPDAKVRWRDTIIGAVVTALLFTIGKQLIGLYLGRATSTGVFGAAGSLIVLLLWIYYSGIILFLGAEFTQVYAQKYGVGVQPKANAVRVTEETRAQQGLSRRAEAQGQQQPASQRRGAQPAGPVATAVPSAVPVTGEPKSERAQMLEAAWPALTALFIGLVGSLSIARQQRKRPVVKKEIKV